MRSLAYALAIALLLVLSALLVITPGTVRASDGPSAASTAHSDPAIIGLTVSAEDHCGANVSAFYLGDEEGCDSSQVYFQVNDFVGDTSATVQIHDSNATRDGLGNPVITWTVPLGTNGTYNSYWHNVFYAIPTSILYSGTWNLTVTATTAGSANAPFDLNTFTAGISPYPDYLFPGQVGSVLFAAESTVNETPYVHLSSVQIRGEYWNGANYVPLRLTPSNFTAGFWIGNATFTLPANAVTGYAYDIWAYFNVTNNGNWSYNSERSGAVLGYDSSSISSSCPTCLFTSGAVPSGGPVALTTTSDFQWYGTLVPAANLTVSWTFYNGAAVVPNADVGGSPPATVVTNSTGQASILFMPTLSVFSNASDHVGVMITDPTVNTTVFPPVYLNWSFTVGMPQTNGANVKVTFSNSQYYAGDTATVSWSVAPENGSAGSAWAASILEIQPYTSAGAYALPIVSSLSGTSGTVTYAVPLGFQGYLYAYVLAANSTADAIGESEASVLPLSVELAPSELVYNPGDTLTVNVVAAGAALSGATWTDVVISETGYVLSSGTFTGSSFQFSIPSTVAPPEIAIEVFASSSAHGLLAQAQTDLHEAGGFHLAVGVSTTSGYSDGSFQPGQTITITYSITSYGLVTPPRQFQVQLFDANGWYGDSPAVGSQWNQLSGSISYTIPSGTSGTQSVYVESNLAEYAPCVAPQGCYVASQVSFLVNPNPGALTSVLGSGSGITVGSLILLVIAILLFVIVVVLVLRRGRSGGARPAAQPYVPPTAPSPSPPAGAAGGVGTPTPWPEPPSTESGQPPLPPPPPG